MEFAYLGVNIASNRALIIYDINWAPNDIK